jgi:TPR repeat protein
MQLYPFHKTASGFAFLLLCAAPIWADTASGMEAFRNKDYQAAFKEWKAAADAGKAEAQFDLGVLYAQGKGVRRDLTEAAFWYRRAAEQGNAAAAFALGQMYARGWGAPSNEVEAMRWFQMAAGGAETDPLPSSWVAVEGYGMPQDFAQAAYWYHAAAMKGHAEAQYALAWLYTSGKGVERDDEQARHWIRASASRGYAPAQARLGLRYAEGNNVTEDHAKAYFWLTLAYNHGEKRFEKQRAAEAAKLNPADAKQLEAAAQSWQPRTLTAQK